MLGIVFSGLAKVSVFLAAASSRASLPLSSLAFVVVGLDAEGFLLDVENDDGDMVPNDCMFKDEFRFFETMCDKQTPSSDMSSAWFLSAFLMLKSFVDRLSAWKKAGAGAGGEFGGECCTR